MRFKLGLIIVGGFVCFLGSQELTLANKAKAEPQLLTLEQLEQQGYGDNAHVQVSGLDLATSGYSYETDEKQPNTYNKVWLPAVSMTHPFFAEVMALQEAKPDASDADYDQIERPQTFKLLVLNDSLDNNQAVNEYIYNTDTVQGLIINDIDSLTTEDKNILLQSYPNTNFNNVILLDADRAPAGAGKIAGFFGGGSALMLAGLALFMRKK